MFMVGSIGVEVFLRESLAMLLKTVFVSFVMKCSSITVDNLLLLGSR